MEYFSVRSPWDQGAAQVQWDNAHQRGIASLLREPDRPDDAPNSCEIWFPMWCDQEHWPVGRGVRIRNWNSKLYGVVVQKGPWLDMPDVRAGEWHVASPKLQRILDSAAPRKVQWLPFRLRDPFGRTFAKKYAVANYLEMKDALDRRESILDEWATWRVEREGLFSLREIVLNRKRIGNAQLFSVYGHDRLIVVREDLRETLERAKISGCSFGPLVVV